MNDPFRLGFCFYFTAIQADDLCMMDALLDLRLVQEKSVSSSEKLQDEEVLLLTLGWHMESADLGQFFLAVS